MSRHYDEVINYFNSKAEAYDDVDKQAYWVLSDILFKEILKKELPGVLGEKRNLKLLDAGAGTGRWTLFLREIFLDYYDFSGLLIDISPKMMDQALIKLDKLGLSEKFKCQIGNIEDLTAVNDKDFDLSISFYNVLSFVDNPQNVLGQIFEKLKDGGVHVSIVANKYHAYYFSILTNRIKELELIANESKVRFNDNMPAIYCFTPEEIKTLYLNAGFKEVNVYGGPNFIYPGMEETYIHGHTANLQKKILFGENMNKILSYELKNYKNSDIAGRGNVLFILAKK